MIGISFPVTAWPRAAFMARARGRPSLGEDPIKQEYCFQCARLYYDPHAPWNLTALATIFNVSRMTVWRWVKWARTRTGPAGDEIRCRAAQCSRTTRKRSP